VCSLVATSTTAIGFECQPPGEFYPCASGWSCAESTLTCTSFGNGSYCVQLCSSPEDCFDPLATCQPFGDGGWCGPRYCGPHAQPANGALLGACNAASTGDGQCLDLPFSNGAEGTCARTGTLQQGSRCDYYPSPATTDALCEAGDVCFVSAIDGRSSRCLPACDGTHGCTSSETCLVAVPPIEPPPLSELTTGIGFGACVQKCTLGQDGGCAAGFTCRNGPLGIGAICDVDLSTN
jgi:hypothetical protein